jgi:hypothetical protein
MDYNRTNGYTSQEMGFPGPSPPPAGSLPPGGGGYTTPYFLNFASLLSTAARTYRFTFDEALRNSPANARAMKRDGVLLELMQARKIPTAALSWHINPWDETDPAQVEGAAINTEVIKRIPNFTKLRWMLLEAIWYGRAGVELHFAWKKIHGRQCLTVDGYQPINGDSLRYRRDGQPGILVHSTYPGKWESTDYGPAHFIEPDERYQYLIHEHEPEAADFLEGELAGSVHGVGVRGKLYWTWWIKQQIFALLMNFLERYANGLTIYYYDAENQEAKGIAEQAAATNYGRAALAFPRWRQGPDQNAVQRVEVGTAAPTLIENLITEYFDGIMRRMVLGQSLSSDTAPTGMGSGVAEFHGMTLARIIKYDAGNLDETMQYLLNILAQYNTPGVEPGQFASEVDTPNATEVMGYAEAMYNMGVALDEEQLYKISQLTKPKAGSGMVSKLAQMAATPTADGQAPEGVPTTGDDGGGGQGQGDEQEPAQEEEGGTPIQTVRRQSRRTPNAQKAIDWAKSQGFGVKFNGKRPVAALPAGRGTMLRV